jgi:Domain of unknown function (DUF932)
MVAFNKSPYGIDERQPQYMHRKINGIAAADLGTGVVPRIRLAVNREQYQGVFAGHLAKRCQRRAIKRSTHRVPSEVSKPSPDPSRLLASKGGWGYSKDRSVDLIKTGRNHVDTRESNLTYQLRIGIFRVVCTNGLIVSHGAFPAHCVSHRGNVVEEVVAGALKLSEEFERLAAEVERMEQRRLLKDEQVQFAEKALALRFLDLTLAEMQPSQLLNCRRVEDTGDDLWRVLNRCQEGLLRGGLSRRAVSSRLTRTRPIFSIAADVRLNSQLWDLAMEVLAARRASHLALSPFFRPSTRSAELPTADASAHSGCRALGSAWRQ